MTETPKEKIEELIEYYKNMKTVHRQKNAYKNY